jgi:hypothetical protein
MHAVDCSELEVKGSHVRISYERLITKISEVRLIG